MVCESVALYHGVRFQRAVFPPILGAVLNTLELMCACRRTVFEDATHVPTYKSTKQLAGSTQRNAQVSQYNCHRRRLHPLCHQPCWQKIKNKNLAFDLLHEFRDFFRFFTLRNSPNRAFKPPDVAMTLSEVKRER